MDLMPEDEHGYRVAFIEAFRRRGIYPRDVARCRKTACAGPGPAKTRRSAPGEMEEMLEQFIEDMTCADTSTPALQARSHEIWEEDPANSSKLHGAISVESSKAEDPAAPHRSGADRLSDAPEGVRGAPRWQPVFSVQAVARSAPACRRTAASLNQVFITLLQKRKVDTTDRRTPSAAAARWSSISTTSV